MKKSQSLTLALAVAGALAIPLPAGAQRVDGPSLTWRFSVWGNPRAFTRAAEYMGSELAKRTNDKFTLKIAFAGQLSPERENLDNIRLGAFEGAMFCASYHPGKNPALMVLDLPFLPLDNLDIAQAVYEKVYQHPYIVAEMKKWNAKLLMGALLPQYEFMGVGNPPRKLEDWKGLRVRALGGLGDAMRVLGAAPTTVPATEVYTALDRGTVSAASFPFTYAHVSYKLHEISKWYTENLSPGTINCPMVFAQSAWDKLPPQYQKLVESLKPAAYQELKKAYAEADDKNLPMFKQRLTPVRYSDVELDRFRAIAGRPVWDKWVAEAESKGVPAKELLQLILDTAKAAAKK
jgi:TRAP-type C4-dicarboxylate transport system substrate-binding protein